MQDPAQHLMYWLRSELAILWREVETGVRPETTLADRMAERSPVLSVYPEAVQRLVVQVSRKFPGRRRLLPALHDRMSPVVQPRHEVPSAMTEGVRTVHRGSRFRSEWQLSPVQGVVTVVGDSFLRRVSVVPPGLHLQCFPGARFGDLAAILKR